MYKQMKNLFNGFLASLILQVMARTRRDIGVSVIAYICVADSVVNTVELTWNIETKILTKYVKRRQIYTPPVLQRTMLRVSLLFFLWSNSFPSFTYSNDTWYLTEERQKRYLHEMSRPG